jgi:outer membrane protein assembly factor BamB
MYRTPATENRSILVTAFSGKIFGLDRVSGAQRWAFEFDAHAGEVELAIESGVVVACNFNKLAFIDYATGAVLRIVNLVGEYPRRPTMLVDQGQILIARNGEVACYALSGDALWLQPFTGKGFGTIALGLPGNIRQADDAGSK